MSSLDAPDFFAEDRPDQAKATRHRSRGPVEAVLACNRPAAAIAEELRRWVIGQDLAVEAMALALRRHYIRIRNCIRPESRIGKENVLLLGPTGCGKSRLVRFLPKLLPLPYLCVDANCLTESGWAGASTDELLAGLANTPSSASPLIPYAIVAVDEIDKKRRQAAGGSRDISGAQAQAALLSWLDSGEVTYQRFSPGRREYGTLDASGWLVVCSGAFVGIEDVVRRRLRGSRTIGLDRVYADESDRDQALLDLLAQVNAEDLEAYGLIPELVGRLHTIVPILPLSADDLIRILVDTPDSPIASAQEWAGREGFTFHFTLPLLEAIADQASASGLGARALYGLVSRCTRRALFEVPADRSYRYRHPTVHLDVDALRDGSYRVTVRRKQASSAGRDEPADPATGDVLDCDQATVAGQ